MALNLEAMGKPIGPVSKDYTWKDVVLYALGVGSGSSELEYCYEKQLKVLPAPSVMSVSAPLASASPTRNSSLRVLFPPSARPVWSSRLMRRSGPASWRERVFNSSNGVGSCARVKRGKESIRIILVFF